MHAAILPLSLTLFVQGLFSFAMFSLPVMLPAYAADVHVSSPFAGTVTAIAYGGAALTALFLASDVRRVGAVRTCQFALVVAAAGLTVAALGTLPTLVIGAFAVGLGYGPITAASALLLTQAVNREFYGLAFSINRVSVPGGAAIAGMVLPVLSGGVGWRTSLFATGLFCLVLAVVLQQVRRLDAKDLSLSVERVTRPPVFEPLRRLLSHPKLRVLTLGSLAYLSAQICLMAFTVAFLVGELSFSYVSAGAVLAAAQISGVVARLSTGYLSDHFGRGSMVIAMLGLATALATGLLSVANPAWQDSFIMALFLLYGVGALGWNGVFLAELVTTVPAESSGEIASASAAIAYGGAVAGPAVFSMLLSVAGYRSAFLMLSLVVLGSSIALIRFDLNSRSGKLSN